MKLSDRQKRTIEKLKGIDTGNDFFWDEDSGIAKFIKDYRLAARTGQEVKISACDIPDDC